MRTHAGRTGGAERPSGNPAPEGPITVEGIEALTKTEASAYIDALKASQGPNIENLKRQAEKVAEAPKEDTTAAVAAIKSGERTSLRALKAARAAR